MAIKSFYFPLFLSPSFTFVLSVIVFVTHPSDKRVQIKYPLHWFRFKLIPVLSMCEPQYDTAAPLCVVVRLFSIPDRYQQAKVGLISL